MGFGLGFCFAAGFSWLISTEIRVSLGCGNVTVISEPKRATSNSTLKLMSSDTMNELRKRRSRKIRPFSTVSTRNINVGAVKPIELRRGAVLEVRVFYLCPTSISLPFSSTLPRCHINGFCRKIADRLVTSTCPTYCPTRATEL